MKGILADINITGQVRTLVATFYTSDEWSEVWNSLGITFQIFANVGLDPDSPDDLVWQTCQDNELVLVRGYRFRIASVPRWLKRRASGKPICRKSLRRNSGIPDSL